jgi:hypothetical protein
VLGDGMTLDAGGRSCDERDSGVGVVGGGLGPGGVGACKRSSDVSGAPSGVSLDGRAGGAGPFADVGEPPDDGTVGRFCAAANVPAQTIAPPSTQITLRMPACHASRTPVCADQLTSVVRVVQQPIGKPRLIRRHGGLMRHNILAGLVTATALYGSAATALAQDDAAPQPPPQGAEEGTPLPPCPKPEVAPVVEAPPPVAHKRWRVFAPSQVGLTTGAGVGDFFGKGQTAPLDAGAAWNARVTVGQRSILAGELAYVGGMNNVTAGADEGHLNSNGLDADLRVNLTPYRWQPYVFGGVGYSHLSVGNSNPEIAGIMNTSDDAFTVPAGGGMAVYLGRRQHFQLDARGTYRFYDTSSLYVNHTTPDVAGERLHQWTAQANLGYTF